VNKTEVKAYEWLKNKGLDVFPTDNPDIVCSDGTGYEVKTLRGNQIMFTERQVEALKSYPNKILILVFRDEDTEPYKIFSFEDLEMPGYHEGVRLHIANRGKIVINLDKEQYRLVRQLAILYDTSVSGLVTQAVVAKLEKEVANGVLGKLMVG